MKTGFDMLLWTTHVTEEHFPLLEKIKQVGYDGVEIPVFEGDVEHFEKLGKVIKDNGLDCASVTVIPDEQHNPVSAEDANRKGAVEHLKWAIDCSAAINSEVLCGPLYQPLGVFTGTGPTEEEKQRAAEVHRQAAEFAKKANLIFGAGIFESLRMLFPKHDGRRGGLRQTRQPSQRRRTLRYFSRQHRRERPCRLYQPQHRVYQTRTHQ